MKHSKPTYSNSIWEITCREAAGGLYSTNKPNYGWEIAQKILYCGFAESREQVCSYTTTADHLYNYLKENPWYASFLCNMQRRMLFTFSTTFVDSLEAILMAQPVCYDPSSHKSSRSIRISQFTFMTSNSLSTQCQRRKHYWVFSLNFS